MDLCSLFFCNCYFIIFIKLLFTKYFLLPQANEQIEVAILSALFKSAKAKATESGNPRASLLRLAMIWDRFDIAKAQIFGDAATSANSDAADENKNNPVCRPLKCAY